MQIEGNFIDVVAGEIYPAKIHFSKTITKIERTNKTYKTFIAPGFIDSHIRIEDSFLSPVNYTKLALLSGVTTVIEDFSGFLTHVGPDSLKYLISEFKKLPIDFHYLFPLNVTRYNYESSPSDVKYDDFSFFLRQKQCLGLTQVDKVSKIIQNTSGLTRKLNLARSLEKPIISNINKVHFTQLNSFAQMGVRADLGSNIYQEAFEKACFGLKIKIVEGTKRKTLSNLIRLAKQFDTTIVSEEKSALELQKGYFKTILKKAVSLGLEPITAIKNVTLNPANLFGLNEGVLAEGRVANIVEIDNLKEFDILKVIYQGEVVVKSSKLAVLKKEESKVPKSNFELSELIPEDLEVSSKLAKENVNVVCLSPTDTLAKYTTLEKVELKVEEGQVIADSSNDILKVVVANRYGGQLISIGFVKGFGLTKGAIATSIGGSSGNIIAIGINDSEIVAAINGLHDQNGGFFVVDKKRDLGLNFPIYGIVSNDSPEELVEKHKKVSSFAKRLGCNFESPLDVLGSLMNLNLNGFRLTDCGLVDVEKEEIVEIL